MDLLPGKRVTQNLDQDIFKACSEIFEQDFRRLMNLPHLCLDGLPQEKVIQATVKFNRFQAAMAEFIHLLFLPVKESLRAMGTVWVDEGDGKSLRKISRSTIRGG